MKIKIFLIMSLLSLSMFFSACSSSKLDEPNSQEYGSIVGEFKSLAGIKVDKIVTHLFQDEDGNIYYAFSDRYDLDKEINQEFEASGVILNYESLDKPVFKVTRISDAPEKTEEAEEAEILEYSDSNLGLKFSYPNNWELSSSADSIHLNFPEVDDLILFAILESSLRSTSDNTTEERSLEIHTEVSANYPDLSGETYQITMIGVDQQFSLRYKLENGNVHYFVPRGADLFEFSLYQSSEDSITENSKIFSEIISTFRFIPENSIVEEVEEVESSEQTSNVEQVKIAKFREFESSPYKFIMSYPSAWYYSGGSNGYEFSNEPIEDEAEILITLKVNSGNGSGLSRSGDMITINIDLDGKYYSLTGGLEYEDVMKKMAESMKAVE